MKFCLIVNFILTLQNQRPCPGHGIWTTVSDFFLKFALVNQILSFFRYWSSMSFKGFSSTSFKGFSSMSFKGFSIMSFKGFSSMRFFSHCTFRFKLNCVWTLMSRAYKVSTNYILLHNDSVFESIFFVTMVIILDLSRSKSKKSSINNTKLQASMHHTHLFYFILSFHTLSGRTGSAVRWSGIPKVARSRLTHCSPARIEVCNTWSSGGTALCRVGDVRAVNWIYCLWRHCP